MTSYCQYTPDKKEQSTQNQTKICAIIVFYVYFVLYIELLFGDVGLNGSLRKQNEKTCTLVNATGLAEYIRNGFMVQVIMEITPTKLENNAILLKGLPIPPRILYMTLPAINGNNIPCVINGNGELIIYFQDGGNSISRIDHIFCYMCNK